jgi:hypothetical protein
MTDLKTRRIFIAHPKGLPDLELAALEGRVAAAFRLLAGSRADDYKIVPVLGKDDFDARWSRLGSWEAWAREVVRGRFHPASDEPRYHAIVVVSEKLGNATRLIVEEALAAQRPVMRLHEDGTLAVVQGVALQIPDDWKAGWVTR